MLLHSVRIRADKADAPSQRRRPLPKFRRRDEDVPDVDQDEDVPDVSGRGAKHKNLVGIMAM